MLCDRCKMKEAKIYYTEIVDGKKREQHLCEDCAAELSTFQKELSLGSILSGLIASAGQMMGTAGTSGEGAPDGEPGSEIQCATCGMSYPVFRHVGKFGCADCYRTFSRFLEGNVKRIQGATMHTGKVAGSWIAAEAKRAAEAADPAETSAVSQEVPTSGTFRIRRLELALKNAIAAEEFEEAAKIRDQLRELRAAGQEKGGGQ